MNLGSFGDNGAIWHLLHVLFLGQVVSFAMSLMSFSASVVASLGVGTPLTLSFFSYLSLSLVYGSILLYRRQKLMVSWYWYVLLGFIDVQGNYLVNKAYQYTSNTSVTLFGCWTIAWVIALTWLFLGTRYTLRQFFGATICVVGLGLVLLSDNGVGGEGGSNPLLGDAIVSGGTLFMAMSNVGEEFCVKKRDRIEVVAMTSLFGAVVSSCEIAVVESKSLESVTWTVEIIFAFAGYVLSSFMFYTLVPYVLKMSGSTMYSLSVLTSNMWAVVIRIFFYRQKVDSLYYVSFAIVVFGLVVYSETEKDHGLMPALEDKDAIYQVLNEGRIESGNETPLP